MMHELVFTLATDGPSTKVQDVVILLAAAAVVAVGSRRLRLPTIPGYLLVGALIGSHAIGLVESEENIKEIGDLAIILLMFTIGMHMDLEGIRSGMVRILSVGVLSTIAVILMCWVVGLMFGLSVPEALTIGMAMSISSTAVALGILNQRRETHLLHGRLAIGISLVQDLLSVAVLGVLPAIAAWEGVEPAAEAVSSSGMPRVLELLSGGLVRFGGLGVFLAFTRYVLPRLLREASRGGGTEQLLVLSAAVAMGAAGLTWWLGFGPVLGAFLAGFMLASTPFKYQLAGQLSPLRDLFMAVFFTSVGMSMNIGGVISNWWVILLGVGALLIIKTLGIGLTTWACGATAGISATVAFLLGQAGEFSLVVMGEAAGKGIISDDHHGIVIAITVVSLVGATPWYDLSRRVTPMLLKVPTAKWIVEHTLRDHLHLGGEAGESQRSVKDVVVPGGGGVAGPRLRATLVREGAVEAGQGGVEAAESNGGTHAGGRPRHVIIAGFGVVGRNLAEHLAAAGIPYNIVDLNSNTVRKQTALGRQTIYGDIANPDVLEQAGIYSAEAVMLTIPDDEATLRACQAIRSVSPEVFIAARTSYLSKAIAATELGADYVTVEEVVTAQDMAKHVMSRLTKRIAAQEASKPTT